MSTATEPGNDFEPNPVTILDDPLREETRKARRNLLFASTVGILIASAGDGFSVYPNIGATNLWPAGAIPLGQEWLVTHVQNGADLERLSYIPSTK